MREEYITAPKILKLLQEFFSSVALVCLIGMSILQFSFPNKLAAQTPVYLDSTASVEERVADLLGRMTLDEKIGQMTQAERGALSNLDDIVNYNIGSILSGGGSAPSNGNEPVKWADMYDSFQQKALQSRLKIPIIYGIDAVHGHNNVYGAVIFPHNIGMGATGDSLLAVEEGRITALEMSATGADWTFAPCIAVPQDERWGRTYEGFGETPELAVKFGAAEINGLQNNSSNSNTNVAACAKHYMGDGGTTGGIDQGNTELSEEELRRIHLPGYIEAVKNGVKTIMASYSSWNGVKMHGNKYLLTDVLKTELGFKGFVVSDWAGIDQLPGDYTSDVENSINAGVDMVMVPNKYVEFINTLKSLVQQGKVSQERIDDAVARILKVKFELGLFEHPYANRSLLPDVGSQTHRDVAREAVRKSLVMLKKNDGIMPLKKSNVKILVAGEHADNLGWQCGGWSITWQGGSGDITQGTTILEGLKEVAPQAEITYDPKGDFADSTADYIIAVIGEQPYAEGKGDRTDLTVDLDQIRMIQRLRKLGIPIITILISGRPLIINPVLHYSDVMFAAWLPGTEGAGIAEVLFGDYTPSGTLPVTWPKNMAQVPINYGDSVYQPLFPYKYGLTSYDDSPFGSPPVFNSAMVIEGGNKIEIEFNKSMKNAANTSAEFKVTVNGNRILGVDGFSLSLLRNNVLILDLSGSVQSGEQVSLEYNGGNLKSEDGGVLENFKTDDVINSLDYIPQPFNLPGRIEAEDYTDMFGVQLENTSDTGGGMNVGWIDDGDWLEYDCNLDFNGTFWANFRIASESAGGKIQFWQNDQHKLDVAVPVTGGWQNWQTVTNIVELSKGSFTIRLVAEQGGFNINWFEFATITNVSELPGQVKQYNLAQNYPNPFNPSTKIKFDIAKPGTYELSVYNILGKKIAELTKGDFAEGKYEVVFDAEQLSSGIYFYRLNGDGVDFTKKMMFLK